MSFTGYALPIELPHATVRSTSRSSNNSESSRTPQNAGFPPQQKSLDEHARQPSPGSGSTSRPHSRSSSAFNLGVSTPSVGVSYRKIESPRPTIHTRTSSGPIKIIKSDSRSSSPARGSSRVEEDSVTFSPETTLLPTIEDEKDRHLRATSFSTIASNSSSTGAGTQAGTTDQQRVSGSLGISAPPSARTSSTSLAAPSASRPGPTPHPSVKPLSSKDIRLLQESLQISPNHTSPGGNHDIVSSPLSTTGANPFGHGTGQDGTTTPGGTRLRSNIGTAHQSGTATPLTTEHNRAKYEAYRVLLETGTTSLISTQTGDAAGAQEETGAEGKKDELEVVEDETTDVGKLRKALKAVLHDAEDLSRQNLALRTLQSDLETKLKITMSNLQLAEMNSELLEEALKRGGEGFAGRMGPVVHHGQYASSSMTEAARNAPQPKTQVGFKKDVINSTSPVRHSMDSIGAGYNPAMVSAFGYGGMRGSLAGAIASGHNSPVASRNVSRAPSRQGSESGRERESSAPGVKVQPPSRPMSTIIPAGFDATARPQMTRRRSSDGTGGSGTPTINENAEAGARSVSGNGPPKPSQLTRANTLKTTAMPTPRRPTNARPPMERSATTGPGSIPGDLTFSESLGSVGSSLGGFFRKNLEKNGAAAGFMRELGLNQLKMPDLNNLPIAMPTPGSMTPRSEYLAHSPPTSTKPIGSMLEQPSGPSLAEVQKLKATLAQSQTTLKALTGELDTLKKAKSDLESELESLSQALFEEANKMVAEERKKHSATMDEIKRELGELREELDEVRKEREAVKRTMVLLEGGTLPEERKSEDTKTDGKTDVAEEAPAAPPPKPRVATAEEVEQLMKRMEEDFGKL